MWKEAYIAKLKAGLLSVYLPRATKEYLAKPTAV